MKITVFCLFVLLVTLNANFTEHIVEESQQKSTEQFWTQKNIQSTTPMELPVVDLSTMKSLHTFKLEKISKSDIQGGNTKPVPPPYSRTPHKFTGKLFFETTQGRGSFEKVFKFFSILYSICNWR
jgi:hypothetical protein